MKSLKNMVCSKSDVNCCMRSLKTLTVCFSEKSLNVEKTPKKKLVVIKRSFPSKFDKTSSVLESKEAAVVIKRLNWENKQMYGPVLSAKGEKYDQKKVYESNQIIQHKTLIPIVEPSMNSETNLLQKSYLESFQTIHSKNESILNVLLNFPLMNKLSARDKEQTLRISELNFLRKELETFSNSYKPSVSVILEKTMPKESAENLKRWKQKMINQLGEAGFQRYHAELLSNGSSIHECINSFLTSTPEAELPIKEAIKGHWKSLKSVFPYVSDIKLMEERISHPFLYYKGVVDCFATYRNQLVVIEWKTSKKAKTSLNSTFDNPLQIAAYVGALNFDPKFQYLANKGLIVVAYENGEPATTLMIDESKMLLYWKEWLNRLKLYWEKVGMSENSQS